MFSAHHGKCCLSRGRFQFPLQCVENPRIRFEPREQCSPRSCSQSEKHFDGLSAKGQRFNTGCRAKEPVALAINLIQGKQAPLLSDYSFRCVARRLAYCFLLLLFGPFLLNCYSFSAATSLVFFLLLYLYLPFQILSSFITGNVCFTSFYSESSFYVYEKGLIGFISVSNSMQNCTTNSFNVK